MRMLAPLIALCWCVSGCHHHEDYIADPLAPGATGYVETAAADLTGYVALEIRGFPAATDSTDDDAFRQIPADYRASSVSTLIDGVPFPYEFKVGAQGIGATSLPYYRVVAWLARTEGTTAPEPGAPWGTAVVALADCSFACQGTCYCGIGSAAADVMLSP